VQVHQVAELPWVQELASEAGMREVLTAGAMISEDSKLPDDHMVGLLPRDLD
jgi:hypothetical protein